MTKERERARIDTVEWNSEENDEGSVYINHSSFKGEEIM